MMQNNPAIGGPPSLITSNTRQWIRANNQINNQDTTLGPRSEEMSEQDATSFPKYDVMADMSWDPSNDEYGEAELRKIINGEVLRGPRSGDMLGLEQIETEMDIVPRGSPMSEYSDIPRLPSTLNENPHGHEVKPNPNLDTNFNNMFLNTMPRAHNPVSHPISYEREIPSRLYQLHRVNTNAGIDENKCTCGTEFSRRAGLTRHIRYQLEHPRADKIEDATGATIISKTRKHKGWTRAQLHILSTELECSQALFMPSDQRLREIALMFGETNLIAIRNYFLRKVKNRKRQEEADTPTVLPSAHTSIAFSTAEYGATGSTVEGKTGFMETQGQQGDAKKRPRVTNSTSPETDTSRAEKRQKFREGVSLLEHFNREVDQHKIVFPPLPRGKNPLRRLTFSKAIHAAAHEATQFANAASLNQQNQTSESMQGNYSLFNDSENTHLSFPPASPIQPSEPASCSEAQFIIPYNEFQNSQTPLLETEAQQRIARNPDFYLRTLRELKDDEVQAAQNMLRSYAQIQAYYRAREEGKPLHPLSLEQALSFYKASGGNVHAGFNEAVVYCRSKGVRVNTEALQFGRIMGAGAGGPAKGGRRRFIDAGQALDGNPRRGEAIEEGINPITGERFAILPLHIQRYVEQMQAMDERDKRAKELASRNSVAAAPEAGGGGDGKNAPNN